MDKALVSAHFAKWPVFDGFPIGRYSCLIRVRLINEDHPFRDKPVIGGASHSPIVQRSYPTREANLPGDSWSDDTIVTLRKNGSDPRQLPHESNFLDRYVDAQGSGYKG